MKICCMESKRGIFYAFAQALLSDKYAVSIMWVEAQQMREVTVMTIEEGNAAAKKLIDEYWATCDEIEKKAKAEGRWAPGLDGNRELFKEAKRELYERLAEIRNKLKESGNWPDSCLHL